MTDKSPPTTVLWDGWLDLNATQTPPVVPTGAAGGLSGTSFAEVVAAAQPSTEERLLAHCRAFISKQDIRYAEIIYDSDRVIENAYEFIEGVCNIVGYQPSDDDDNA